MDRKKKSVNVSESLRKKSKRAKYLPEKKSHDTFLTKKVYRIKQMKPNISQLYYTMNTLLF